MQFDLIDAIEARKQADDGMKRAADHANEVDPTFATRAGSFLISYARTHAQFISEELTEAAAAAGVIAPAAGGKEWGARFAAAAKVGVIRKNGFGISKRRHCSPTILWESRIYQGAQS